MTSFLQVSSTKPCICLTSHRHVQKLRWRKNTQQLIRQVALLPPICHCATFCNMNRVWMSVKHNVSVIANMLYIKIKKVSFSLLTVHSETRTTACVLSILTTHTHTHISLYCTLKKSCDIVIMASTLSLQVYHIVQILNIGVTPWRC